MWLFANPLWYTQSKTVQSHYKFNFWLPQLHWFLHKNAHSEAASPFKQVGKGATKA